MIPVSRPYLPSFRAYQVYLKEIWETHRLTNDGKLVKQLEKKLQRFWGVKHVVCVSSGTSAIEIALKALDVTELYLSPFSFVATASVPLWLGMKLRFVDLNGEYKGPALVTHVFGLPHLIKAKPVIYDASHAFAVKHNNKSILSYGDVSIISFHATKIFHTVEGGAIVTDSDEIAEKARLMRNFGYDGPYTFVGVGINAKMSEFHAAMGLCNLEGIEKTLAKYHKLVERYNKNLGYSYPDVTYYPVWFSSEAKLLHALKRFHKEGIYPRRYFYPALSKVFGGSCPVFEQAAKTVLCLPLFKDLTYREQDKIIKIAREVLV